MQSKLQSEVADHPTVDRCHHHNCPYSNQITPGYS